MSQGITYLHSHSGLERSVSELLRDKFHVLVDKEYKSMFTGLTDDVKPFKYEKKQYYKVPTYLFIKKGGVFKNLAR